MKRRRAQLASTIERTMQQVLARGLADPRIRGLVTVTGVELNDELRTAYIDISVLPAEHENLTMHGLKAATPRLRREVMERIRTREMPRIEFRLDRRIKEQAEILTLINRAASESPETRAEQGAAAPPDAPTPSTDDPTRPSPEPAP
jgi:ribosome-binding factor A